MKYHISYYQSKENKSQVGTYKLQSFLETDNLGSFI